MWKTISKGIFTGLYAVSRKGEVRNERTGRILLPDTSSTKGKAYLRVTFSVGNKQKRFAVSRLVARAFLTKPEGKDYVNHKDGDRFNNCVDNLEWVTMEENQTHAVETGLCPKREENGNSKYTEAQINQVKHYSTLGLSRKMTAQLAGVTISCVKDVRAGRVWLS